MLPSICTLLLKIIAILALKDKKLLPISCKFMLFNYLPTYHVCVNGEVIDLYKTTNNSVSGWVVIWLSMYFICENRIPAFYKHLNLKFPSWAIAYKALIHYVWYIAKMKLCRLVGICIAFITNIFCICNVEFVHV